MPTGKDFWDIYITALLETWFDKSISDAEVNPDTIIIAAPRAKQLRKMCSGRVCLYISNRWCNIEVHHKMCTSDLELLTLSHHLFYLSRGVSHCVRLPQVLIPRQQWTLMTVLTLMTFPFSLSSTWIHQATLSGYFSWTSAWLSIPSRGI